MTAPQPPAMPGLWWSPTVGLIRGATNGGYDDAVRLVPADDLERLRGIEQRARRMVDNPGRYDEDDVSTARFILGEDTPNA